MVPISATVLIVGINIINCFLCEASANNVTTAVKDISVETAAARIGTSSFQFPFSGQVGITNGKRASIEDYPFMVNIVYGPFYRLVCGGTIIGKKWVLTAARCLYPYWSTFFLRVRSNSTYWNKDYVERIIESWYPHKHYKPALFDYDIGVIKVSPHFTEAYEKPIPYADVLYKYKVHMAVKALGWGREGHGEEATISLRQANMIIAPRKPCKKAYKELHHPRSLITKRQVCATGWGQGICEYDSGGPLFHDGRVIGIALRGFACTGRLLTLDVFTRISKFNKFLADVMKGSV